MQIHRVPSENAMQAQVPSTRLSNVGDSSSSGGSTSSTSSLSADASVSLSAASLKQASSTGEGVSPFETSGVATVAGKDYAESVQAFDGVIVASVPNPPGATATGSSVESAEYNLQMKLDTIA